jgi:hypothetical protein
MEKKRMYSKEDMIEFAKLHVEAALKAANNTVVRDKYSIPNCYPLNQIK